MEDSLKPQECAVRLKALADPDRLRIVERLRAGHQNVSELAEALEMELANVSHHLGILRQAGIVETEKQGRFAINRLHPDVFSSAAGARTIDLGCCKLELPKQT
ncbi:transcriptional regulator, ArsR family [Pirellula staleyi DSM 6068]|uniref:Transcriptional regulator, ArsR family n=1 Tax=Pirellula staleyi (strain ATCC 27377 / DSM 6068 / ICPB 4128) TaxID=530564 RepID=D2QWY6_PIRSD|nr:metalloregulator ArsR/SmtB family transcription factor [Pirellula staleyi]ADB16090.1 transcriptional regulator, ArsR family [Pirellula staleyi DSM 6068]